MYNKGEWCGTGTVLGEFTKKETPEPEVRRPVESTRKRTRDGCVTCCTVLLFIYDVIYILIKRW